ncbi:MAG: alpha/beta fold hydrolase [Alphaproteobacteria bacterium]|nr:alpha/beta fold hydrolase [Alphaproteobacteria bacterium]
MPITTDGLHWERIDLTAPWRAGATPMLLHHGAGSTSAIWSEWLPALASSRPLLLLDMPSFGRSAAAAMEAPSSLDRRIADVLAVLDAAGAPRAHLVGESIGGTVLLALALRHPQRCASLAISNATHRGDAVQRVGSWRGTIAGLGQAAWAAEMMEMRFAPGALDPARAAWFARMQAATPAAGNVALGEMLMGIDLTDELARLRVPLLLLFPDSSPFIPVGVAAEIKAAVPHAELRVFPGVRHGLPFSHAADCAAAAGAFAARHEAGAP